MSSRDIVQAAAGAAGDKLYVDDVFSTYLYTGTGAPQTITNGIDLAGEGGLVWIKNRTTSGYGNFLFDTERGATKALLSNGTNAEFTEVGGVNAFISSGFSLDYNDLAFNRTGETYASWTFRKAPRFFDVVTYTGTGSSQSISHNLDCQPGMIIAKRTDSSTQGDWVVSVLDTSVGSTYYRRLYLNKTDASLTNDSATATTTTFDPNKLIGADGSYTANQSSATYVAYLFAHDPLGPSGDGSDGLIACGSFTTDGSGNATVDLGWEPQFVLYKASSTTSGWLMLDSMRGMPVGGVDANLIANSSNAEDLSLNRIDPTATGFTTPAGGVLNSATYIYLAIRRPNKPPTSGTEVYNAIAYTGDGSTSRNLTGAGFVVDAAWIKGRVSWSWWQTERLRGGNVQLESNANLAEQTNTNIVDSFALMDGVRLSGGNSNNNTTTFISHFFRRAPGFFDEVCYTGTGVARTVAHNLGAVPELMIVKRRDAPSNWIVYSADMGNTKLLVLNSNGAVLGPDTAYWNSTTPSSSSFTVGPATNVNQNTAPIVAYLFATLPGISKVGSYTGNGSNQTINCGFSAGARFVLIKRTDSTGDWYVWDSARGIVAGNDPHLSLNTTAAEVTTDDSVDTDSTGFIVNQLAATNINVNTATYIFLSIA